MVVLNRNDDYNDDDYNKNHHPSGDQQHDYHEHGIEVDGMMMITMM